MSIIIETPSNPTLSEPITPIAAGNASDFRTALNDQFDVVDAKSILMAAFLELLTDTMGNGAVSGGDMTPNVGLSVNVAALSAFVGTIIRTDASQVVGGLANGFNHIFLRQDGTWTSNTTGDDPDIEDGHGEFLEWGIAEGDLGDIVGVLNTRKIFGSRFLQTGIVQITVGGTDYFLSGYEAAYRVIEATGAIIAARGVVVPETGYNEWIFYNNTTGGFNVTIKTDAGSGVSVAPGERALVYFDGTDVVAAAPNV